MSAKALFHLAVRIEEGVAECNGTTRIDRVFQAQQLIGFGKKKEELKVMLRFLIGRFC